MRQLPSLKTTDHSECRFYLFDDLPELRRNVMAWPHANAASEADEPEKILVVVDQNVRKAHRALLEKAFPDHLCRYYELPPGESSKSIHSWNTVIDFALSGTTPIRRNTPLIAIGGGVTGDLSGFAAASLMRGLPLYHVPTTLLAMVDSSIGGKTGINHSFGKNIIGAFYHPQAVLFDLAFLETLPQREWLCGISEVLKYGYIRDPELLEQATKLADPEKRDVELLCSVIEKSVTIKADIVTQDAREAGQRAWLNFGHTFAHALETLDGYQNINHGEAVYAGMIAALFVSRKQGFPVSDEALLALKNIYNLNLNRYTPHIDELVSLMYHDKKNRDATIQLVLIKDYGKPVVMKAEQTNVLHQAWNYVFEALS